MRISCPVCSVNYEVADRMLGAGRKVRCGQCGHQWVPGTAPARNAAPPPRQTPAPNPEPLSRASLRERLAEMPRPPAPPQPLVMERLDKIAANGPDNSTYRATRRRGSSMAWLGWVVSLAVWGLVIWAAYAYRSEIMDAWPPSQWLYAALGLGPGA